MLYDHQADSTIPPSALPLPPSPALPPLPCRPRGFPLFAHRNGQWAKKVRGRLRYFGPWSEPEQALRRWEAQKDDLLAGRPPRPVGPDELLLHELLNSWLTAKKAQLLQGEICQRSWDDYLATCQRMTRVLGRTTAVSHLVPADFERLRSDMAKTWGPVRIGNELRRVRMPFAWAAQPARKLIPELPSFGDALRRPTAKTLRKNRASKGPRMFEAAEIRLLLEHAGPVMRAMILLAINCGYGNHDVATIQRKNLNPETAWAEFPRPKTGIPRKAKLWPETLRAVRRVLRSRDRRLKAAGSGQQAVGSDCNPQSPVPNPSSRRRYRRLVFVTRSGRPWTSRSGSPVSQEFGRLLRRCGLARPGLNFYALRHTFETVAGDTTDQVVVSAIMGHAAKGDDMSAVYRERIAVERYEAAAEHVRQWLLGNNGKAEGRP